MKSETAPQSGREASVMSLATSIGLRTSSAMRPPRGAPRGVPGATRDGERPGCAPHRAPRAADRPPHDRTRARAARDLAEAGALERGGEPGPHESVCGPRARVGRIAFDE